MEPDYLRFDFNHHSQLSDEDIARIEELVIGDILSDEPVQTTESTLEAARAEGAMSFFGDKYGEIVRVVRAGEHSVELCGGTHVPALGRIGGFVVRGESSVGANLRRIEALTGKAAHEDHRRARGLLHTAAESLHVAPDSVPEAIARLQSTLSQEERQRKALAANADRELAASLAESAVEGSVVARLDDRDQQALRAIAAELVGTRRHPRRGPDRLTRRRGGRDRRGDRGRLRATRPVSCAPWRSWSAVAVAARTGAWPSAAGAMWRRSTARSMHCATRSTWPPTLKRLALSILGQRPPLGRCNPSGRLPVGLISFSWQARIACARPLGKPRACPWPSFCKPSARPRASVRGSA